MNRVLVTYLAHDLDDPSIWRRVEMLRRGGARVRVAGFRRAKGPLPEPATVLGRTANGRMLQRVGAIARAWPRIARMVPAPDGASRPDRGPEVILARNLEMLVLGAALQRQRPARLVYELLDIHAMMLGDGAKQRALRGLEARLMARSALVVVSSPAFVTRYLEANDQPRIQTLLVENKPFADPVQPASAAISATATAPDSGARRVIGWFGMLRCRFSLEALDRLTRAHPGVFRVILRGRPALDVLGDFQAVVDANPDMDYLGAYRWPEDLPSIYGQVDLAWLIDRYQAGQNSDWLLPNRMYEGCLNGAVPITLRGTEVARQIAELDCGVEVASTSDADIAAALNGLAPGRIAALQAALAAIPRARLRMDEAECTALTQAICGRAASTEPEATAA